MRRPYSVALLGDGVRDVADGLGDGGGVGELARGGAEAEGFAERRVRAADEGEEGGADEGFDVGVEAFFGDAGEEVLALRPLFWEGFETAPGLST